MSRCASLRAAGRRLSTKMPVGASPHLMLNAHGKHESGAVARLTSLLVKHGASIAASKKMTMQNHFSLLMSVWVPPSGSTAAVVAELERASGSAELGCVVQASILQPEEAAVPAQRIVRRLLYCRATRTLSSASVG